MPRTIIEFKTKREDWNWYSLKDGTKIKVKSVVIAVVKSDSQISVNIEKIFGVVPPEGKLGPGDTRKYAIEELTKSVIEDDLEFSPEKEDWNIYELDDGSVLQVKPMLVKIGKTDKYDSVGIPRYVFQSTPLIKFTSPKKTS